MGLFDFLFGKPNFHRFDDSFAFDRPTLFKALLEAIKRQWSLNKVVLLVVHFPETFERVQDWLSHSNLDYEIATRHIDADWIRDCGQFAGNRVTLAISDLINDEFNSIQTINESKHELSLMVFERHPVPDVDEKLERFAKAIPIPTQLGYFIALDDPIVKSVLPGNVVDLFKQFGLGEQELIASDMLTKRLNQALRKQAKANPSNQPADSPLEWLAINRETSDLG